MHQLLKTTKPLSDETLDVIESGGYSNSLLLRSCMTKGYACKDRLFCPRCCMAQYAIPLVHEFVKPCDHGTQIFFLTLAPTNLMDETTRFYFLDKLPDETVDNPTRWRTLDPEQFGLPFTTAKDLDQLSIVWRMMRQSLQESIGDRKDRRLKGLLLFPRLSVSFRPLRVLPFVNAVGWTDLTFTEDSARAIRQRFRSKLRNSRTFKVRRYPWFFGARLHAYKDQIAVIAHSSQPIPVVERYRLAETRPDTAEPELEIFLTNVLKVHESVCRVTRYGGCHEGSYAYMGKR